MQTGEVGCIYFGQTKCVALKGGFVTSHCDGDANWLDCIGYSIYCDGLHCTAMDYIALQWTTLHCDVLHCTVMNYIALWWTALYIELGNAMHCGSTILWRTPLQHCDADTGRLAHQWRSTSYTGPSTTMVTMAGIFQECFLDISDHHYMWPSNVSAYWIQCNPESMWQSEYPCLWVSLD